MLLTLDEIVDINQNAEFDSAIGYARAIESAVLEKLKAQEPVGYFEQEYVGGPVLFYQVNYKAEGSIPLYSNPLPPDDVVRDAERLDWLLKNPDATVCSDGAYGPFHIWFRYSNRTTEPANTARAAIDAAMEEMK